MILWREEFNVFMDYEWKPRALDDETSLEDSEGVDEIMTEVAKCLGLGRGQTLITESGCHFMHRVNEVYYDRKTLIPKPPRMLTQSISQFALGAQEGHGAPPTEVPSGPAIVLWPNQFGIKKFAVPTRTSTMAQNFIQSPSTRWIDSYPHRFHTDVSACRQLLIWARMMLLNPEDNEYLKKADIVRGVMASTYHCHVDSSLVAAFLTYWNIDGHTLITSQEEMGYPLHRVYDAMGIPFSGRLYEEYIPLPDTVQGHVQTLYNIYVDLCPIRPTPKPGLVTIEAWVNHFFEDKCHSFGSLLADCYADPDDPVLQKMGLRVEVQNNRMSAFLGDQAMHYRPTYPSVVFRPAFIAAWLCTYCIPIEEGQYIRPEVFIMAVKLAKGNRRAIGVASLAFLYRRVSS